MGRLYKSKITFLSIVFLASFSIVLFLVGAIISGWDVISFLTQPTTILGYIMLGIGVLVFLYMVIIEKIDCRR